MRLQGIRLPGFTIRNGKLVPDQRRLPVNVRLKQASSKRVKVVRGRARIDG